MLAAGLVVAIPAQADQWQQRASGISARTSHTVVWTGTEMIAWGGGGEGTFLNSGGRYTPATDSWLPTSLTNAPSGRWMHAAVWTGTEMLVWGGRAHFDWLNHFDTGGRYDPATDTWRPMSAEGAPAPRSQMAAVWTGSELLVWGGMANNYGAHADGARYDPATDTWTPMAAANAPSARVEPTAIWTGTEMIVWGGVLYDPQTKVWTTYNDGARYNPVTDTWTPMTTEDAPESRTGHTAVWTGMRMLVWGGRQLPLDAYLNSGGSYDPQTDSWSVLATNMAPGKRAYHAAVWTGSEMLVWGGCDPFPSGWLDTGARYDPASDAWTPMTQVNAPAARFFWRPDAGLWTGEGMLLFGGSRYSEMSAQNSYYLPNAAPPQCAPVPPGLVSWWRAEGDAVDAAGGHDGSVLNGAGFAGGRVGSAFSTAAFGQRVIVADAAAFELTESLTIEGWVFIHGDGGIVFMRGDNRTGLDSWILWLTGPQRLSFRICSATEAVEVEGPVLYEQWQHVAATLDGASGEMRLYVNGSVVGQTNTPVRPLGPLEGPEPGLAIGNHSGTSLDFGFRGLIDELSLYGRALSAAEVGRIYEASSWGKCRTGQAPVIVHHPQTQSVQAGGTARFAVEATGTPPPVYIWLFNGEPIAGATASVLELANVQLTQAGNYSVIATNDFGFAVSETATLTVEEPPLECLPAPSSLVGWWPGNGDSADAAGTNSAVLIGGAAFGVGKVGQGFDLNGSTAFVRVPASSAIDVGAGDGLTVETWIRPDDVGSERPVAEWHRWSGNGFGVHLRVGKLPGNLYASLVDTTGADHVIDTPAATIVAGTWQHVALTYDKGGGVAKLYVNGTLAREVSVGSFTPQTTYDLNIGALASSLGAALLFDGVIDEVSVYGRALATAELQAIFGAGTAGKCPPAPPPVRTYDLSADYTLASNPHGPWSYGAQETLGGAFSLLTHARTFPADNGVPIASWDWPTLDGPLVNRVMGPGTAISAGGAFVGPPGTMYVASGPNGTPRVFGVVRFTVPPGESGQYRMVATVAPVFDGDLSADADFHVMKGEQELFGVSLPPNTPSGYINELALEAGQVLDFAVGRGADGVALRSALKLALTIVRTDVTGAAPVIVQQPLSQSVRVGETARFAVEATGDPPLAYIWLFNSEPIAGATASVLELANVQLAQAGNYSVIATNDFGFAVSETASLTVEEPPPVRTYDLSADYTLASNPNGPWSYGAQEALGGAFSLLAHARTFPADNGVPIASWDWAGGVSPLVNRVMGPGTAVSAGGAFVGPPGTIYFVPGPDGTARNFGVIRFTVPPQQSGQYRIEAAVSPLFDGELSADCDFHVMKGEQELFGMSLPPNTSSGYTNELALEVGQALDFAIGRGADGLAARSGLKIALRMIRTDVPGAPPTITLQPQSQTVVQGATATFAVAATGDAPLAYVWLFNGEPVAGATASVLELANVQPAQAGGYFVVVSNEWGHAVSDVATLTVTPGPACAAPLESLVSWWAGEGNGVDQQGTNHGALMGGVTFADGQVGAAFNFVGTGHVRVVRSDTLNVGTGPGLTLEGWIKPSDTANGHVIAEWNRGVGDVVPGVAFWLGHPSLPPGVLIGTIADGSGGWPYVQSPAGAVVPGVWQHVALTYDRGSGNARLFVNGVEVAAKGVGSFIPETSHDLYFGIRPPGSYAYRGLMDEMSLYNGALSATELAAIVAAGSAGKCSSEAAPVIVEQPRDRRVALGEAAEFSVSAGGTRPLGYQWRFNGSALPDATNATLILPAVAFTDTGTYSVVVSNAFGIAVSDDAMLTVLPPPSRVAVVSSGARSGSAFDLPIQLVAFGNENALGFSLQFDPGLLEFLGVLPGPETPADSSLVTNTNDAAAGRVGMALALPAGTAFNAGTQQVLAVRFQAPDVTSPVTVPVAFGDVPTLRQVADALAQPLPAVFTAGEVRVERIAFEADVAPRPGGDQILSVIDWVQVGRFVAGLDTPEGDEFQRADCAPMDTAGNGVLSVTDWVQAGRYAIGATPPIAAGGPESPEPENPAPAAVPAAASPRALRLPDVTAAPGTVVTVAVRCDAAGNENALGFSVAFDPATLAWVGAAPGPGAAGATWYVNSASLPDGVVGFVLALPAGVTLEPGASDVAHFSFRVRATATGSSALAFADQPILREVSDPMAEAVACDYAAGSVTVDNSIAVGPPLGFRRSGSSLVLFWPVNGLAYDIEVASSGLDGGWQRLDVDPVLIDDQNIVILTVADATHAFYRLRQR